MRKIKHLFTVLLLLCSVAVNAHYFEVDGICYNSETNKTVYVTSGVKYTGDVVIPNSVTYNGNTYSVTRIGYNAFLSCSGLTSITIPNSVTSIDLAAFGGCKGLTSIEIPTSVTSIGDWAFDGCTGLTSIIVKEGNTVYDSRNNCNAIIETSSNTLLTGCKNTVIPNSVTTIGNSAFSYCSGLTSIEIPNSVTSIWHSAFNGCSALKDLCFEDGEATLTLVYHMTDEKGLFYDCPLESVYLGRTLPYSTMEYSPFYDKATLKELIIGNSVTSIGEYAFRNCSGLTSVIIPDNVTNVGNNAFDGCRNLETLYISNAIESIGAKAFANCNKILEIKIGAKIAVEASEDIFSNIVYNNACLYVPSGRKFAYEKTSPWKNFYILEMDYTGIDEVESENGEVKAVYDLQGRKVENPTKGIYIINGNKVLVK